MKTLRAKTNAEWIAAFTEWKGTPSKADWAGTPVDLFSPAYETPERKPWDTNPGSRRYIDFRDGELQVSVFVAAASDASAARG